MSQTEQWVLEAARIRAFLESVPGVECGCRGEATHNLECLLRRGVPAHPGPAPHGSIEVSR
jgi:hypothetical protein